MSSLAGLKTSLGIQGPRTQESLILCFIPFWRCDRVERGTQEVQCALYHVPGEVSRCVLWNSARSPAPTLMVPPTVAICSPPASACSHVSTE